LQSVGPCDRGGETEQGEVRRLTHTFGRSPDWKSHYARGSRSAQVANWVGGRRRRTGEGDTGECVARQRSSRHLAGRDTDGKGGGSDRSSPVLDRQRMAAASRPRRG